MDNQSTAIKACYPHNWNWIFTPFRADGFITDHHITLMIRKQTFIYETKLQSWVLTSNILTRESQFQGQTHNSHIIAGSYH
eukprot:4974435-Ditylum_brightwellii.AAC.1